MRFTLRRNRPVQVLMSAVVLLAIGSLHGPAFAGPLDDTVWNLTGTGTVRIGNVVHTAPISQTLTLNADRTYLVHDESGSSVPDEMGAWFEYRGQLRLFAENILDYVEWLESQISADAQEPVRIFPVKSSGSVIFDSRTGKLLVKSSSQTTVILQNSNFAFTISSKSALTGVQAP